jgi:hypothetical protein
MVKTKRFFALLLSLCLLPTIAFATDISSKCKPLEYDPAILQLNTNDAHETYSISSNTSQTILMENLNTSSVAYDSLMRSFYNSQPASDKNKLDEYTVSGITADNFPESYAGAYTNQNLDLVVLLTENAVQSKRSLSSSQNTIIAAANTDAIIFATAKYSYCTLVSLMDDILQYIELGKNSTEGFNIISYSLDDYNNRVVVGLEDISVTAINSFKSTISDSPAIEFIKAETQGIADDTTLKPGLGTDTGSIGFHIYKYENNSYVEGFVTAAHCYAPDTPVIVNGTTVADTHEDAWQNHGRLDAVFCIMRPGHSFSNTISYIGGTLRDSIDANLSQGHPVTMVGRETRGSSGTITYISHAYSYAGGAYYDLAACNYSRAGGDSGGIVISTRTGLNYIAGIHKGTDGTYSVFTKAPNITQGLGLTFNNGSNR